MAVDLGESRAVAASHYSMRRGYNWMDAAPRNWELQGAGSMAGPWVTLKRHEDDQSLREEYYAEAHWVIDGGGGQFFRCFRIVMHGPNAATTDPGRTNMLECCGFELYGMLRE